jgi:hypothetical protein
MDDPAVPSTKKRGRPKGGRGRGKSRGLVVKKRKGIDHNKKQAVDVAEPSINCNKLSLSQVDAEDEETSNIAPNTLVEDESVTEIEHGDEDQDQVINAGDADGLVEFIEERNEPVFQADIIQRYALKVFDSMEKVRKAGGILVEGLGKNYGRRYENVRIRQPRGSYRPRRMARDDYGEGKEANA